MKAKQTASKNIPAKRRRNHRKPAARRRPDIELRGDYYLLRGKTGRQIVKFCKQAEIDPGVFLTEMLRVLVDRIKADNVRDVAGIDWEAYVQILLGRLRALRKTETQEILANPDAMKAIRAYESGQMKLSPVPDTAPPPLKRKARKRRLAK